MLSCFFRYRKNRGSCLMHDQTRYIFETNTIGIGDQGVNVDDIVETANHFRCIDYVIDHAEYHAKESVTIDGVIDFHVRFECIHPFQEGNGRVKLFFCKTSCKSS